jgi:hypothetical protein
MKFFTYMFNCLGEDCEAYEIGQVASKDEMRNTKNLSDDLCSLRQDCAKCGSDDFKLTVVEDKIK